MTDTQNDTNRGFDTSQQSTNNKSSNYSNTSSNNIKLSLPNSELILSLGIIAIITAITCCGAILSPILATISLILYNKAKTEYNKNNEYYSEYSLKKIKIGKTLSIVALSISLFLILLFVLISTFSSDTTYIINEGMNEAWDALGY